MRFYLKKIRNKYTTKGHFTQLLNVNNEILFEKKEEEINTPQK